MVGTEEESFEWLDIDKHPEEVRILQDTVDVLSLPRPGVARHFCSTKGKEGREGVFQEIPIGRLHLAALIELIASDHFCWHFLQSLAD